MYTIGALKHELIRDEGWRVKPYTDSVGKLTIGVGWNLSDNGIPEEIINRLMDIGIAQAESTLDAIIPDWRGLSDVRQRVLINMAFNLGGRLAGFARFLAAVKTSDWQTAADEMLESKWAHQVGTRSARLAEMMRSGRNLDRG